MQCPSCQFENMPGSRHCARCAASLALASMEIDVHPPRATSLSRRLSSPSIASLRRGLQSFQVDVRSFFKADVTASFHGSLLDYLMLLAPGVHQIRRGHRVLGWIFLGFFLSLLILSVSRAGTILGGVALGFLYALHVSSTVDAMFRSFADMRSRVLVTSVVALTIGLLIYVPLIWSMGGSFTPLRILWPTRNFNAGDLIWYNPSVFYR